MWGLWGRIFGAIPKAISLSVAFAIFTYLSVDFPDVLRSNVLKDILAKEKPKKRRRKRRRGQDEQDGEDEGEDEFDEDGILQIKGLTTSRTSPLRTPK